jgi:glycosyltransferase involved in cell wall biosynthesis
LKKGVRQSERWTVEWPGTANDGTFLTGFFAHGSETALCTTAFVLRCHSRRLEGRSVGSQITVVIPAYNAAKYLDQTLQSVFSQTLVPEAVIIVDDCSTDDTVERVKGYGKAVTLIRCSRNSGGTSLPRNIGIDAAPTPYVVPCDADDLLCPHKLQRHAQTLQTLPQCEVFFGDYVLLNPPPGFDEKQAPHSARYPYFRRYLQPVVSGIFLLERRHAFDAMLHAHFVGASSLMFSKRAWKRAGGYDRHLRFCEDMDFALRLAAHHDFGYVDEPVYRYRIHDQAKSANQINIISTSLRVLRPYLQLAEGEHRTALQQRLAEMEFDLSWHYTRDQRLSEARTHWMEAFRMGAQRIRLVRLAIRLALGTLKGAVRRRR